MNRVLPSYYESPLFMYVFLLKGRTSLMWAAALEDRDEVILVLCRHGANLQHK